MKQDLSTLLSTEMDRKDFLKYVAAASAMAMGGGLLLQSLGSLNQLKQSRLQSDASSAVGYGSSIYGGNKIDSV